MTRSSSSRRVRRYRAAAAAAVVLALGPTAVPVADATPRCTPGSAGVGDTYYPGYGNGGYDVGSYYLDIGYDPGTDVLDGRATIKARATRSLCSFHLDLVGLTVRSVEVDGREATWRRSGQELVVTPAHPLRRHHRFWVVVEYDGVPTEFTLPGTEIPSGFMTTDDGATVAGQPEVATAWFPANDHPSDKASYVFDVTVPRGVEVVANGHLAGARSRNGSTRYVWVAPEPMASYLATIDIGQWDVRRWRTDHGLPVYDAVDSAITGGLRAEIDSSLSRQGEVLDVLGRYFGRYPFSTVGGIVDNQDDLYFALETQTRPVYSKYFWLDGEGNPRNADWVVVHELAHQWFGDEVALDRWQDIWLNEGFASYAEWLWAEHEGDGTPAEIFRDIYGSIPADDEFWDVEIGDPGVDLLFSDPVYVRGAMTVQALREEVGDRAFWRIVRAWTTFREHGTTPEFMRLAERLSGRQLDDFFDAWLFTGEKPALPGATSSALRSAASSDGAGTAWLANVRQRLEVGPF